ncbi:hypothetical protein PLCT1_02212 [Planctomycetaceae bacterium]|nr:hypothetical protein PLCT1_02212 [Planctomycetaceae bacterium]
MSRLPLWSITCLLAASLLAPACMAQGEPVFSPTAGPDSPFADEREAARADLTREERLQDCRTILREGSPGGQIVDAIDTVASARDKADVGLVAPYVSSIEPNVALAAMDALRAFGKAALAGLEALGNDVIDAPTRKLVREQLLRDHIYTCCLRDRAVNPLQLDYASRLDELYSIGLDMDALMLSLLREAIPDLRQDLGGTYFNRRYYYYGWQPEQGPQFIEYGALVIAALAKKKPAQLKRETEGLVEKSTPQGYNYYYGQVRQPATRELCGFLAQNGINEPMLKMISDMEMTMRFQQDSGYIAGVHIDIAAAMMSGGVKDARPASASFSLPKGAFEVALIMEHIDTAISLSGSSGLPVASQARYLKARLLMVQGDDGGALRELEESIEASDEPILLLGVDAAFTNLAAERRFQTLLDYTSLISRRVDESSRPYKAGAR